MGYYRILYVGSGLFESLFFELLTRQQKSLLKLLVSLYDEGITQLTRKLSVLAVKLEQLRSHPPNYLLFELARYH